MKFYIWFYNCSHLNMASANTAGLFLTNAGADFLAKI